MAILKKKAKDRYSEFTTKQAGERLNVSHEKIRQLILEGRFPHAYKMDMAKTTSPYMIPEKDLIAFEKSRHAVWSSQTKNRHRKR